MNESSGKKNALTILALCALIGALAAGILGIFALMQRIVPPPEPPADVSASQSVSQSLPEEDAPRFCPSCGKELHEGFQWGQFCPYCGEKVE